MTASNRLDLAAKGSRFSLDHPVWVALGGFVVVIVAGAVAAKVGASLLADTDDLESKDRASEIASARTAVLALFAGGVAVVGAIYTGLNFGLSRIGNITERFAAAIEQLSQDQPYVRLGAIYTLESIASESRGQRAPVTHILDVFAADPSVAEDAQRAARAAIARIP